MSTSGRIVPQDAWGPPAPRAAAGIAAVLALAVAARSQARAAEADWRIGLSLMGKPKYQPASSISTM